MDMLETGEENTVFQKVAIIVALAFFMVLPVSTVLEAFGIEFVTERVFAWWWLLTALFCLAARKYYWVIAILVGTPILMVFCGMFLAEAIGYYGKEFFGLDLYPLW